MELPPFMRGPENTQIRTIEMHTTGEPTRIVYDGFPDLPGTLLEQRALAESEHDYMRRALICEPRGHREMYGAVLRPRTELTETGDAHIGVLFLTNEGYSTMCGHATLALGRLLVDYAGARHHGMGALDAMNRIVFDEENTVAHVNLHAPCGLVHITVPIVPTRDRGWEVELAQPISYLSVPSYATGISVPISIPPWDHTIWPELSNLESKDRVIVDIAYGGAFYIIVRATSLGFKSLGSADLKSLAEATRKLKAIFNTEANMNFRKEYLTHPEHSDLEFLYGVIVTEPDVDRDSKQRGSENGLCFFADGQVDRSPTGSGVQARVALAYAKGERTLEEPFVYHSPVSKAFGDEGAFVGEAVEEVDVGGGINGVIIKVSGWASYTGCSNFIIEDDDEIGKGFWFEDLMKPEAGLQ